MSFHYSPKIVTDGLILCYDPANTKSFISGATNLYDLTKNNYDGQLINGPVYTGTSNGSISLDSSDDRIGIPTFTSQTDGTVSLWFRNNNDISSGSPISHIFEFTSASTIVASSFSAILGNVSALDDEILSVYISSNSSSSIIGRYDSVALNLSGTSLPSGWYNLVVSRDSSGTRVYLNNVLLGAPAGTNITTITTSTIPFFRSYFNLNKIGRILNGLISHFMVYDRALNTVEIDKNYKALKNRFGL